MPPAARAQAPGESGPELAEPAPPAPEAPPPRLGEAAENAYHQVLDAARRDSASWARRTQALKQHAIEGLAEAWAQLRRAPIRTIDGWLAAAGLPDSQALAAPASVLLAGLVLLLVWIRGSGDLKVSIEYPAELRGTFSVRVARKQSAGRRGPRTASPSAAQRAKRQAGASSRTERHLVSRETDLPGVRIGRWFVTVDGFLQPPDDEAVIATHYEEREVRIRRRHTVRIDFDFRPKQCPVDVKVVWDDRPVPDALIVWQGQPHSLRYARGGPVRLGAELGDHTLVVGARDRVAQIPVSVKGFQPTVLEVDLADRDKLLFTGCPPAVEPYLHGDVQAAARALEREGEDTAAHLILAREHEERNDQETAAHHYEQAGRPLVAAEIRRELSQYRRSAALYETAGEWVRAAEMYRSAGEVQKAGETFVRARDYQTAADCFRNVGNVAKWVEALERAGSPFQAARVALDHGDEGRAIRSLQLVSPSDGEYVEAGNLLVEVLQRQGHLDMAQEKVEEIVRNRGADGVPMETLDRLATLLEEADQYQRALELLDAIRRRDATFPNLATRIEDLRKKQQRRAETPAPSRTPA
jgi:tetratricopeptide (TPR) repeat protein